MYLFQKSTDTKCAARAAARGTALRAEKVLTSRQVLPQPLQVVQALCLCHPSKVGT